MIVLNDFLFKEGYDAALRRLIGRQCDLCVIQGLTPQDILPDFGGDLKLIDIEDADVAEITASAAPAKYYRACPSFRFSRFCGQAVGVLACQFGSTIDGCRCSNPFCLIGEPQKQWLKILILDSGIQH